MLALASMVEIELSSLESESVSFAIGDMRYKREKEVKCRKIDYVGVFEADTR